MSSEGPVAPGGLLDGQQPLVSLLVLQELEPCEACQRHAMTTDQVKRSGRSDEVAQLTPVKCQELLSDTASGEMDPTQPLSRGK